MGYKFLATINVFEVNKIQSTLYKYNIESIIEDNYHFNLTAGWVDPFCNYNERRILVKNEDIVEAKKILNDFFGIKFK
mgnify:CR=1 FL=1|tara:strand:- start:268 stop:501 length:234 start_codon:yes stop_codon:yes gene_type:complete